MTIATEVVKHLFDFKRDTLVFLMTQVASALTGIVDEIVVTFEAMGVRVDVVWKRDRQQLMALDVRVA